jgi:hypothetical protein
VSAQDDKTVTGVLVVKSCPSSAFIQEPSRCTTVGDKLSSLLNDRCSKAGVKDQHNVNIVKTTGNATHTMFQYTCPCEAADQQTVINSLKDACNDQDFHDCLNTEKQPDSDESKGESDEKHTTKDAGTPKVTQKDAPHTTSAPATHTGKSTFSFFI